MTGLTKWTAALLVAGWCATSFGAGMAAISLERARDMAARFQSPDRQLAAIADSAEAVLAAREATLDSAATRRARETLDGAWVLRRQMGDGPCLEAAEADRTRWLGLVGLQTVAVAAYFFALFTAGRGRHAQ